MVYLFSVSILSAFDIEKAKDENGREITPEFAFTSGALTYVPFCVVRPTQHLRLNMSVICESSKPKDFQCSIKPRSAKAEALLRCIEI